MRFNKNIRRGGGTSAAFTLAEVLITLGIIGVVASLTIPQVITKYQKLETISKLKKEYGVIQNAIKLSEQENGEIAGWQWLGGKDFFNTYLKDYIDYVTVYSTPEYFKKIASKKNLNNTISYNPIFYSDTNGITVLLKDGAVISLSTNQVAGYLYWNLAIDVNGAKKPNTIGKDTFLFEFSLKNKGKIVPFGALGMREGYAVYSRENILGNTNVNSCNRARYGLYCSSVIMNDGWQIAPDYPW